MLERPELKKDVVYSKWLRWNIFFYTIAMCILLAPFVALYIFLFIDSVIENPVATGILVFLSLGFIGLFYALYYTDEAYWSVGDIFVSYKYKDKYTSPTGVETTEYFIVTQYGETYFVVYDVYAEIKEYEYATVVYNPKSEPYKTIVGILDMYSKMFEDKNSLEV